MEIIKSEFGKLYHNLRKYQVKFIDDQFFKKFINSNMSHMRHAFDGHPRSSGNDPFNYMDITGYFDYSSIDFIKFYLQKNYQIRLICPSFGQNPRIRDLQNIEALKTIQNLGANVKINNRMHGRMFLSYDNPNHLGHRYLILGSFDFNTEGFQGQRNDIGIETQNIDLVKSALEYFNQTWSNQYNTKNLEEAY